MVQRYNFFGRRKNLPFSLCGHAGLCGLPRKNPGAPKKALIAQSTIVSAGGYKNLWFEHHDKYCLSQMKMKLNQEGGCIYLSDSKGNLLLSQEYPAGVPRGSWARVIDGADEWGYTNRSTPEASNENVIVCEERLEAPKVSMESCFFEDKLDFYISIPEGTTLRYTTDGSTPSLTQGLTSTTGFFTVDRTSVYRFAFYKEGFLNSPVITRSYLLHDKDFSLPVISIATDPRNLYSDELGIFVRGVNGRPGLGQPTPCNWNMDWDRPCNFEYLNKEGMSFVNQEANISRSGGWSRSVTPYSFKVQAKKQYEGQNILEYPFFENKPFNRNKALFMRNGGNGDSYCRVKDAFLQRLFLTSEMEVDAQEYQPVAHYINGIYKGVINMREPSNKHFVYANYGLDEMEIDFFEIDSDTGYVQKCGTREAFERWYRLSKNAGDDDAYNEILKMVDIDEYCNYMAVEFYLGNWDWMRNNVKAWRPADKDGRFRYILFDLDGSFSLGSNIFTAFEEKQINTFSTLYGEPVSAWTKEVEPVTIFLNMLQNAHFRRQFIDAFCLVAGSVYDPVRCDSLIRRWTEYVAPMQVLDDNGYRKNSSPWSTAKDVINNLSNRQNLMYQTLKNYEPLKLGNTEGQHVKLSSNIQEARLSVNGQTVPTGKFNGQLFGLVTLRAEAPMGYVFDGWKKVDENPESETLIRMGDKWTYYDKGNLDGKNWTSIGYSTSIWGNGAAPLGYGNGNKDFNTIISYGNDGNQKYSTYYFRKVFTLSSAPSEDETMRLNYLVDDGFVVYINGVEAGRYNMPSGDISYNTLASNYAAVGYDSGSVEISNNFFKNGLNCLAVEVHNKSRSSSDICWDASLVKERKTETYIGSEAEIGLPVGNFELIACFSKTSTGSSESAICPVVINEVSAANSIFVSEYYKKDDWVELYNMTDEEIDLRGMFLSDDIDNPKKYQIDADGREINTLIPAHGFKIIWCDKRDPISQLHAPFKLGNEDNACVLLTAADGSWADTLVYCAHTGRESVGRFPDGGINVYRMARPTIEKRNAWNSYTEKWEPGLSEISSPKERDFTNNGAMSITFRNNVLHIRSEEEQNVTLTICTIGDALVFSQVLHLYDGKENVSLPPLLPGAYIATAMAMDGERCSIKFLMK